MATADTIAQKLKDVLLPQHIEVEDVSHHHAGHAGWRDGGGAHFTVTLKAASFASDRYCSRLVVVASLGSPT